MSPDKGCKLDKLTVIGYGKFGATRAQAAQLLMNFCENAAK